MIDPTIPLVVTYAVAGAAWRRWLGSPYQPRWLKMIIGGLLAGAIGLQVEPWQVSISLAVVLAVLVPAGWSFGHRWDRWWQMSARYGAMTIAISVPLALAAIPTWSLIAFALSGVLAPIFYDVPRRLGVRAFTSWGELGLGALIYGALAAIVMTS